MLQVTGCVVIEKSTHKSGTQSVLKKLAMYPLPPIHMHLLHMRNWFPWQCNFNSKMTLEKTSSGLLSFDFAWPQTLEMMSHFLETALNETAKNGPKKDPRKQLSHHEKKQILETSKKDSINQVMIKSILSILQNANNKQCPRC